MKSIFAKRVQFSYKLHTADKKVVDYFQISVLIERKKSH